MYRDKKIREVEGIKIKGIKNTLSVYLIAVLVGLIVTRIVLTCIMSVATIDSASMLPTLMKDDKVVVSKLSINYQKGDIVVFKLNDKEDKLYAKRVVGTGGDKVSIQNGIVYVNKKTLRESYVLYSDNFNMDEIQIPENEYFLLGDNRLNSTDSRYWEKQTVKKSLIQGKIVHILTKN